MHSGGGEVDLLDLREFMDVHERGESIAGHRDQLAGIPVGDDPPIEVLGVVGTCRLEEMPQLRREGQAETEGTIGSAAMLAEESEQTFEADKARNHGLFMAGQLVLADPHHEVVDHKFVGIDRGRRH